MEFVSYSRRDNDFARRITENLKSANHEVWIDWEDIPPTADWWQEISNGIQKADSFIFIITPDSVHSEVCRDEIEYAVSNNKRFIPILYRELIEEKDKAALHPTISSHNWIFFRETDDFTDSMRRLISALETDLDHVSEHTRLLIRAIEWDQHDREKSLLLNGSEINRAEAWLSRNINKTPEPTDLHSQYIFASRSQENSRQRRLLLGVTVAMFVAITLAIISLFLWGLAEGARRKAVTSEATAVAAQGIAEAKSNLAASLALAANARNFQANDNPNLGLRLALEAYAVNQPAVADVQQTLANIIYDPGARFSKTVHEKAVMDVALSTDGTQAVSVSKDGKLIIWDSQTGDVIQSIDTPPAASVAFSPDDETIAVGLLDGTVILWDLTSGEEQQRLSGHSDTITSLLFTPDGTRLVSGSIDRSIRVWDVTTGAMIQQINSVGAILKLAMDSTGERIVSGSADRYLTVSAPGNIQDRTVRVWDIESGNELYQFKPESGFVRAVSFSPDGQFVASGTWNQAEGGKVQLWDLQTGELDITFYGPTDIISDVLFVIDGGFKEVIASSWDGSISFWDVETGVPSFSFKGHNDQVQTMAISPDGEYLVTGTGNTGNDIFSADSDSSNDTSVWVWDLYYRGVINGFSGHENWVWDVAYSPDGLYGVSGSGPLNLPAKDATVRIWDITSGVQLERLEGHTNTISGVTFNTDGTLLASASWDGTVRLWDVQEDADGLAVSSGRVGLDVAPVAVNSVMFMQDSSRAVSALGDGDVLVWDVATGEEIWRFKGHEQSVYSAIFSPDERFVVSGSDDSTLRLWDAQTGAEIRAYRGHGDRVNGVAFSPDNTMIASASWDGTVRLWDANSDEELRQFVGHSLAVFSVDFSPDGQTLISGSADRTLRMWNIATGQEIRQLLGHTNWILSVVYSPDGLTVLSGAEDNLVVLWRAEPLEQLIEWGYKNRYVPVLSCAERIQYNVEPFCNDEGNVPTSTPRPPTATPLPTLLPPPPTHTPRP